MKRVKGALIAGVDEAGRGPLAGPVYAAAVILPSDCLIEGLKDSKQLTDSKREFLDREIRRLALGFAVASARVEEIDSLNIHHATLLAMKRAVEQLPCKPEHVLIDGVYCPKLSSTVEAIVGGDKIIPVISAASILAKVARDRFMMTMHEKYPGYDFDCNKGYGTASHRKALKELGVTPIHRRSYAPVKEILEKENISG